MSEYVQGRWPKGMKTPKRVWLAINPIASQARHEGDDFKPQRVKKMSIATQDDVSALADRLLAASGAIDLAVSWIASKPTLAIDVIERITEHVKRSSLDFGAGMRATITTDGRYLNRETAELLRRNRVKRAIIAIDDVEMWECVESNFSDSLPFPIDIRIGRSNGDNRTSRDLHERIARYAEQSTNVITVSNSDSALPRFAQDSLLICIDAEGRLYICPEEMEDLQRPFGNASTWSPSDQSARATIAKCLHKGERIYNTEAELKSICEMATPVFESWGVIRAWIFGTFALGEHTAFSDIDMLVQLRPDVHLGYRFLDLKRELEERLDRKVGLKLMPPDPDNLSSFYKYVYRNRVLFYEAKASMSNGVSG